MCVALAGMAIKIEKVAVECKRIEKQDRGLRIAQLSSSTRTFSNQRSASLAISPYPSAKLSPRL